MKEIDKILDDYKEIIIIIRNEDFEKFVSKIKNRAEKELNELEEEEKYLYKFIKLMEKEEKDTETKLSKTRAKHTKEYEELKLNLIKSEKEKKQGRVNNIERIKKFQKSQLEAFEENKKYFEIKYFDFLGKLESEKPSIFEIFNILQFAFGKDFKSDKNKFSLMFESIFIKQLNEVYIVKLKEILNQIENLLFGNAEDVKRLYNFVGKSFKYSYFECLKEKDRKGRHLIDDILLNIIPIRDLKKLIYAILNTNKVVAIERGDIKIEDVLKQVSFDNKMNILESFYENEEIIIEKIENQGIHDILSKLIERLKESYYTKVTEEMKKLYI